ncbi:ABC transporter ATP-binding protein [Saccharopolyspora sp. NFXS83]|uniref:ABC transporter ATP-binding protein n=1 Tax=Saccharopolyspora sp. NFXS83 TaxID=2993560 RepID=UPI00224ADE31|nr:ABC transporter ATP-binding protein [Saccharopolyspora sp. NFXS83]MCX2732249.1 ABC transporter ATP-binding protein [Saccharopolyspora sp. NFXS83]
MNVVDVGELKVSLGARPVVAGVSFAMAAGEVTALVGESGSGKTTTGLALLGEHPPGAEVDGEVVVAGHRVEAERPPAPGQIGYIPQHPSAALNPVRRVGSVLREIARRHIGAVPRAQRKELVRTKVATALRRAQLPEGDTLLNRYPHQLSGGQQQRILLAQALVCDPVVVIADEPTTGQDALTRGQIVEELRGLSELGIAVLLLTHDLDVVRQLAHHVLVMRAGSVVESGPAAEVLSSPAHAYTRLLVESQPDGRAPLGTGDADSPAAVVSARELVAGHRARGRFTETLHAVSLEIRAGERIAVVGRSGSGKTTLARCLAGLHPPRHGAVLLDGTPLAARLRGRTREQLADIQYVFQDARASFNEFAPVVDQVARTAERLRGVDRREARRQAGGWFQRIGLGPEITARLPESLSGGELQRAALVRALLADPRVLICDEITSGLDTVTQAELLGVLKELQSAAQCALVVITHDLGVVADLAEQVVIVDEGHIVEQGPAAEVLRAPQHSMTCALIEAATSRIARA